MLIYRKIFLFLLICYGIASAENIKSYESGICKFNLHDYELAPQFERAIVFGVTRILDTYKETFGFSYPNDFKVTVTIFGDKNQFLDYQQKMDGRVISESGYYDPTRRETVVFTNKNSKKVLIEAKGMVSTVFHEANHLILRHQVPWSPKWVSEGLSVYFAGLNVFGKNRRVHLDDDRHWWCKHWSKEGLPITLNEYVSLNYDQWMAFRKRDSNAAYTIGYCLVYFMMSSGKTEVILKELLWEFKKHGKNANSLKTINKHFPGGFKRFEKLWLKWLPKARKSRPLRALRSHAEKTRNNSKPQQPK